MGKTVIPEVVEYTCNKEIPEDRIDATVRASFDYRDLSGSKCGGRSKDYVAVAHWPLRNGGRVSDD